MAKQTFTTGQVLTAAEMTSLQATALGGGATTAKTASYVLVAADAGTVVQMNSSSATTITVNQNLFAAGDSVQIQNVGSGVCTVTAGSATVSTAGSLALSQYEGGQLYFNTTSAALFFDIVQAGSSSKVVQIIAATTTTYVANSTSTFADTTLTGTITPTSATNKVLVFISQNTISKGTSDTALDLIILRAAVTIGNIEGLLKTNSTGAINAACSIAILDSPATTSATTYKTQFRSAGNNASVAVQNYSATQITNSTIILMEVTP
jgi:hypothetical protein